MVNQPRTSSENQSSEATEDDVEAGGSAAEPNGQDEEEISADAAPSEEPPQQEGDRIFVNRRRSSRLSRNTMTLAELEEQRELSRRRSSACVLLAVFVLFRLWIECLQKSDPFLLMLCLLGTSWTARWVRFNREREEELDRRIEAYLQNNNNANEMDRNEYARMSFQAQLALAIMESQRHMMEGGYGRPDGEENTPGVSEEAKGRWKQFQWNSAESSSRGTPRSSRPRPRPRRTPSRRAPSATSTPPSEPPSRRSTTTCRSPRRRSPARSSRRS